MPLSAAKTKEQLENTKLNKKSKAKPTVVTVTLVFDGVEHVPVTLYEALDAKYGTVSSIKDIIAGNRYEFRITP